VIVNPDEEEDIWLLKQFIVKHVFFVEGELKGIAIPRNYLALEEKVHGFSSWNLECQSN